MALPGQLAGLDAIAMRIVGPVLRGAVEEDMLVGTNAIHHGQGGALGMHCGSATLHELHQLLLLLGALDIGGIEYRQQLWTLGEDLRIHAMRIIQAQRGAVQYLRCLENALEAALKKGSRRVNRAHRIQGVYSRATHVCLSLEIWHICHSQSSRG